MVLDISVAVIAVAFIILVIYLIVTLIEVQKALIDIRRVLTKVEHDISPLGEETLRLLKTYNTLGQSINNKSEALNPLFKTATDLGQRLQGITKPTENINVPSGMGPIYVKVGIEEEEIPPSTKVEDLVELGLLGLNIFQKFKKKRW